MKTKHLLWLIMLVMVLGACNRAMSPYDAANHPRGKKCRDIK